MNFLILSRCLGPRSCRLLSTFANNAVFFANESFSAGCSILSTNQKFFVWITSLFSFSGADWCFSLLMLSMSVVPLPRRIIIISVLWICCMAIWKTGVRLWRGREHWSSRRKWVSTVSRKSQIWWISSFSNESSVPLFCTLYSSISFVSHASCPSISRFASGYSSFLKIDKIVILTTVS